MLNGKFISTLLLVMCSSVHNAVADDIKPELYIAPHDADAIASIRFIPGDTPKLAVSFKSGEPSRIWDIKKGRSTRAIRPTYLNQLLVFGF